MPILRAIQADITQLSVDAIVNAANSSLLGGCPAGQARLTRAYRLPAKFVIHTVGPMWHGGTQNEAQLLASCYRESLSIAAAQQLASIAFPCISTGIYGYPPEQAAEVAIAAVHDFLRSPGSLREVIFCCYSASDLALYQAHLTQP